MESMARAMGVTLAGGAETARQKLKFVPYGLFNLDFSPPFNQHQHRPSSNTLSRELTSPRGGKPQVRQRVSGVTDRGHRCEPPPPGKENVKSGPLPNLHFGINSSFGFQ